MSRAGLLPVVAFCAGLVSWPVSAGPPYLTDDPEPVALGHWEFYAASQWSIARNAAAGTAPHVEVNYGALPELQLHVIVPAALSATTGEPVRYGVGDVELGAKYRFVDEGERRPQLGTFPLLLLPTGSAARGLGAGKTQVLLPIWIQKSIGRWTTYGGGGVELAAGARDGRAGWLLQRELGETVILGGETFLIIPFGGGGAELHVNLGAIVNLTSNHHLLISAGPAFGGDARGQAYLAYQLTI